MTNVRTRDVGALDPELKTSPIAQETSEDWQLLRGRKCPSARPRCATSTAKRSRPDQFVCSGTVVLDCLEGLWIEIGPADPRNP